MPTIRFPRRRTLTPGVLATTLGALLVVGGCASPGARDDAPFELSEDYADGVVSYTVQRGDRLGDIAREFTGDVSRWRDIAASNGIDDPRSLRAGAVLRIPASLIPGYAEELAARNGAARVDVPDERPAVATGLGARGGATEEEPPVELSPVDVNRRFELAPIDGEPVPEDSGTASGASLDAGAAATPATRRVRVVGSYTPKGVYAQPAAYSRLMMRVAPGTVFELDGEVGDWYGVVTPDGIGYLRDGDARLLDDELGARTASSALARG